MKKRNNLQTLLIVMSMLLSATSYSMEKKPTNNKTFVSIIENNKIDSTYTLSIFNHSTGQIIKQIEKCFFHTIENQCIIAKSEKNEVCYMIHIIHLETEKQFEITTPYLKITTIDRRDIDKDYNIINERYFIDCSHDKCLHIIDLEKGEYLIKPIEKYLDYIKDGYLKCYKYNIIDNILFVRANYSENAHDLHVIDLNTKKTIKPIRRCTSYNLKRPYLCIRTYPNKVGNIFTLRIFDFNTGNVIQEVKNCKDFIIEDSTCVASIEYGSQKYGTINIETFDLSIYENQKKLNDARKKRQLVDCFIKTDQYECENNKKEINKKIKRTIEPTKENLYRKHSFDVPGCPNTIFFIKNDRFKKPVRKDKEENKIKKHLE